MSVGTYTHLADASISKLLDFIRTWYYFKSNENIKEKKSLTTDSSANLSMALLCKHSIHFYYCRQPGIQREEFRQVGMHMNWREEITNNFQLSIISIDRKF